jgi:hypothetical protein
MKFFVLNGGCVFLKLGIDLIVKKQKKTRKDY